MGRVERQVERGRQLLHPLAKARTDPEIAVTGPDDHLQEVGVLGAERVNLEHERVADERRLLEIARLLHIEHDENVGSIARRTRDELAVGHDLRLSGGLREHHVQVLDL